MFEGQPGGISRDRIAYVGGIVLGLVSIASFVVMAISMMVSL